MGRSITSVLQNFYNSLCLSVCTEHFGTSWNMLVNGPHNKNMMAGILFYCFRFRVIVYVYDMSRSRRYCFLATAVSHCECDFFKTPVIISTMLYLSVLCVSYVAWLMYCITKISWCNSALKKIYQVTFFLFLLRHASFFFAIIWKSKQAMRSVWFF